MYSHFTVYSFPLLTRTQAAYWGEIVFSVAIAVAKISILLQIQRVFAGTKKGILHRSCTALLWLNGGFYTAGSLAGIFSCMPREAAWNPFVEGTCINKMMLVVISCGINVLSDIAILVIPMVCTWRLILPLRKKLAIGAVFATAIL
jgi:large subunit ribosomal protein L36e